MANDGINEVFTGSPRQLAILTPDTQVEVLGEVATSTTLNNGNEAILTEDILVACAVLVASGNYTTKAAVDMALEMNDILVERLDGAY